MAYQPFYIAGLESGLIKSPEAFLIPQDAFPEIENGYIWRGRIKRKLGYELLARLTRVFTAQALANTAADPQTYLLFTIFSIGSAVEADPTIIPGTVTVVTGGVTINEPAIPDGTLDEDPVGVVSGTINYLTGSLTISGMGIGAVTTVSFTYAPGIPVMGIGNRELATINLEELIIFDQIFAYRYNTVTNIFEEWITGTTWNGNDSDFFWTTTYWQDTANRDLFWATNFNATGPIPDPMRFSNGVTWTTFAPATGPQCFNENLGLIAAPFMAFGPTAVGNTPVIPNSVRVTIGNEGQTRISLLTDDGTLPVGTLTSTTQGRNDTGTITYATGSITLVVNPALTADTQVHVEYCIDDLFLHQALAIVPYKDRLLVFNTFEGRTLATSTNFPQRLRFSQNGDPTDQFDGWRSDIPGRGGFIDAPTSEHIVSVSFIRDILIVSMERSTWQIRSTGNAILPFLFEKIDTEYGSDATFSTVQFDKGVLQIGRDALTVCNGNNVSRIDLKIPDDIGAFVSQNDGNKRVHGYRDLNVQLVYWTYSTTPEYPTGETRQFPSKLLVYNYLNDSFSIWNDGFTTLGTWYKDTLIRWQDLIQPWRDNPNAWNYAFRQQNFPEVIGGNQQGFIEIFNKKTTNDQSLFITAIAGTTSTTITSPNHNLEEGQIIRLRSIIGDAANEALNDRLYKITDIRTPVGPPVTYTFRILELVSGVFTDVVPGSVYDGGGTIEVCNNFSIVSKEFNTFEQGMRVMMGYIDFLTDTTSAGEFTCQIFVDQNNSTAINTAGLDQGTDPTNFFNSIVPTSRPHFDIEGASKY